MLQCLNKFFFVFSFPTAIRLAHQVFATSFALRSTFYNMSLAAIPNIIPFFFLRDSRPICLMSLCNKPDVAFNALQHEPYCNSANNFLGMPPTIWFLLRLHVLQQMPCWRWVNQGHVARGKHFTSYHQLTGRVSVTTSLLPSIYKLNKAQSFSFLITAISYRQ